MTRRRLFIIGSLLALTWVLVFVVTALVLQSTETSVEYIGTPTPTERPTRTDVAEIAAGISTPTPPRREDLFATATARFTLSSVDLELPEEGTAQPTPRDIPEGGAYPIRLAIEDRGILASVVVVQTDDTFNIVTPQEEVGYYALTPKIGSGGNSVMIGHVYPGRVFNDLLDIQVGEVIRVTDEYYNEHYYMVEEIRRFPYEVGTEEDRILGFDYMYDNSEERITLVTCYPEYEWTHRFVVRAVPIDAPPSIGG